MTTASDLAATTNAANTWAAQLKAGTPYAWAEAATLLGLAKLAEDLAPPAPGTTKPPLGFYTGANTGSAATALGRALGVTAEDVTIYVTSDTWASIADSGWTQEYANPLTLLLGLNMTPSDTPVSAVGANLSIFGELAKNLSAGTVCRIGYEFDGTWFPWSPGVLPGNTPASFAAAFASIVTTMRAANPNLKYCWCSNAGSSTLGELAGFYPGNGYVDYIGTDIYDMGTATATVAVLAPTIEFAAEQDKPFCVPEWGLRNVDNPAFIDLMAEIINDPAAASAAYELPAYEVAYSAYFNGSDGSINATLNDFPSSKAAFSAAFS